MLQMVSGEGVPCGGGGGGEEWGRGGEGRVRPITILCYVCMLCSPRDIH